MSKVERIFLSFIQKHQLPVTIALCLIVPAVIAPCIPAILAMQIAEKYKAFGLLSIIAVMESLGIIMAAGMASAHFKGKVTT